MSVALSATDMLCDTISIDLVQDGEQFDRCLQKGAICTFHVFEKIKFKGLDRREKSSF